jgi:hypothetical protein
MSLIPQRLSLLQYLLSLNNFLMGSATKAVSTHKFAIVPDNVPVIVHIGNNILAKIRGSVKREQKH